MSNWLSYWVGGMRTRLTWGRKQVLLVLLLPVAAVATLLGAVQVGLALPPGGGLVAFGPVDPQTHFPTWYSDSNGLSLTLCKDPVLCIPDPVNQAIPLSVETGFGAEAFWWAGSADMQVGNGGTALIVLAVEGAYSTGDAAPGAQMSFGRIRLRADGLKPGATYTVTHPFGFDVLVADNLGNLRYTDDVGCFPLPGITPCDFGLALFSRVGPFLVWDPAVAPAPPAGYIGDFNVAHKVIGSPTGNNFFRLEGADAGGTGSNSIQTDLFFIQGQKYVDAVDDNVSVPQNAQRRPIYVLSNDLNLTSVASVTTPANGVSEVGAGAGNVLYTAQSGFAGQATFNYTASNGPLTDAGRVNVTVHAANAAPVAVGENITVAMNSTANVVNVLANDSDPDGDIINVSAAAKGANGQGVLVGAFGANVTYTPKAAFFGVDSFTYTLTDGALTTVGTVNVTVDRPPAAVNDTATVTTDSSANLINVLANDSDPDANLITLAAVTQGLHGTVTIAPAGAGVLYTPSPGYVGTDSFTYTVSDGFLTAIGGVSVAVDRVPSLILSAPPFGGTSFTVSWAVPATWTGAGPVSYDAQVRQGLTGTWTDILVASAVTSTNFTSGLDGQTYFFQVRPRMASGALGGWNGPISTVVDANAPGGAVSVNGGAGFGSSVTVNLGLSATGSLNGLEMSFSNDETTWSGWQGYASGKVWELAPGADGPRTVYARFRDLAQNISSVFSDTIVLDTAPPTGTLSIAGGVSSTTSTLVNLSVSATDGSSGVAQMSFSNDGLNYSAWEAYASTREWTIPGGNGTKTVYARFRDNAGNLSAPASVTLNLSTLAPSSAVAPLSAYQKTASFTVSWSGTAAAGIGSFDVQYRDGLSGVWTDWQTAATATSAVFTGVDGHTYFFRSRLRDAAAPPTVEAYVGGDGHTRTTVDLAAPTGTVSINGGALDTPAMAVTLAISATDSLSGVSDSSFSNDGSLWSAFETFATSKAWNLLTGDGQKTVWTRFRDTAGNISDPVSDTIRLDTTVSSSHGASMNDGAVFTNQVTVTLSLPANPGTAQVMISNDGGFSGAAWEPYSTYRSWAVTQYGSHVIPRLVYVKYRDVNGNVSAVYQDDIILDLTAPTGSVVIPGAQGAAQVRTAGTRALAAATNVTLHLSATDDVSGVSGMMVSNSPSFAGATWEPLTAAKSWSIPSGGRVYVAFKDYAGNVSPTYAQGASGAIQVLPSMTVAIVYPRTGGSMRSIDGRTVVSLPGDSLHEVAELTMIPAIDSSPLSGLGTLRSAGPFLSLTARTATGIVTTFANPYTMTMSYTAEDLGGVRENTLGIYSWSGTAWVKEPSSSLDTTARTVTARPDHMSYFALLGESSIRTTFIPVLVKGEPAW